MSAESVLQGEGNANFGCFQVDGRFYGLDVARIREVVRWEPITPLPKAPSLIDGVIDLRGAVIPVVNLGRALDVEEVRGTEKARIVIAEVDGLVVGFCVDAAVEVLSVDRSLLTDPPLLATRSGYDVMDAVLRREGELPVLVVSLESLLELVHSAADEPREAMA